MAAAVPLRSGLFRFIWRVSGWHQLWLALLSVAVFVLNTAPLEIQRRIVNDALHADNYHSIVVLMIVYLAIAFSEGVIKLIMNLYRSWISERAIRSLRESILNAVRYGLGQKSSAQTEGVQVSMVVAEAEPIGGFVGTGISEPLLQGGMLISILAYLFYLHPLLGVISFIVFSPQIIFLPLVQQAINRRVSERIKWLRKISVSIVNGEGAGEQVEVVQYQRVERVFQLNMGVYRLKFSAHFAMNFLQHVGTASVLGVGGWFIMHGEAEVGTLVAFVSGLAKIEAPWRDLANWYRELSVTAAKYHLISSSLPITRQPLSV